MKYKKIGQSTFGLHVMVKKLPKNADDIFHDIFLISS